MSVRTYGILSPFVGGDYYGAIIAGMNAAAVAHGDRVMAVQTLDPGAHSADRAGVPDFRRPVAWRHLDGLVVLPGAVDLDYVATAREAGLPVVFVAHDGTRHGCSSVLTDNRSGVREAVLHLIGHGHERIAFAGHLASYDLRERHEGYREAMLAHGFRPRDDLLFDTGDNGESGGERAADALLRAGMPATAVLLGTDRNAIGLAGRLAARGHTLPDDLAVVGFDDIPDAAYLRPGLSTVRQDVSEVGAAAYGLLRRPPGRAGIRQVGTSFVRRASCGCPGDGLEVSEERDRLLFSQVQLLQSTLNIQYELGIELFGRREDDPRTLDWLGRTPARAGCLGLWADGAELVTDPPLQLAGAFRCDGLPARLPVSEFPPDDLFTRADGAAEEIVFVVPVRSRHHDWGLLAAVGAVQATTPPGREMMNHSGRLLAAALDHEVLIAALRDNGATSRRRT